MWALTHRPTDDVDGVARHGNTAVCMFAGAYLIVVFDSLRRAQMQCDDSQVSSIGLSRCPPPGFKASPPPSCQIAFHLCCSMSQCRNLFYETYHPPFCARRYISLLWYVDEGERSSIDRDNTLGQNLSCQAGKTKHISCVLHVAWRNIRCLLLSTAFSQGCGIFRQCEIPQW